MTTDERLDALAEAYGILPNFRDLSRTTQPTSPETKRALLRANGVGVDNEAMIAEALAVLRAERAARLHPEELIVDSGTATSVPLSPGSDWHLELENQTGIAAEGRAIEGANLPALQSGIHTLRVTRDGCTEEIAVISTPPQCPSVEEATGRQRIWGVTAALYGLRSSRNQGVGDFEDLASAAEIIGQHGADFIGINPVHNIGWNDTDTISPYSPSHRGFLNTSHIAVDQIPGTQKLRGTGVASKLENVTVSEAIRYDEVVPAQKSLLEQRYRDFQVTSDSAARSAFDDFCSASGSALAKFALYEALSEQYGPDWRAWPAPLQDPGSNDVDAAAVDLADRVLFHKWLQWIAGGQLSDAQNRARESGMALGLYLDLAVGPRRWAAETWCEQGAVAQGVALGAPPDHLSPDGQNWQLAGYAPRELIKQRYGPIRRVLATAMRNSGVLRIDHVLGMNRSYWIPDDGSPGGYIRQPLEALLAMVAIEAERSGTVVIGEDLGLVPDDFRETLATRGLYGYSVLQYERNRKGTLRSPGAIRPKSLVCFGTHDTPTLRGFCEGSDIDWWQKLGWIGNREAERTRARRISDREALLNFSRRDGLSDGESFSEIKQSVHRALAKSPAEIVSIQLDDLCEEREAQNLPGTINAHPNWRRRYSLPVERFDDELGLCEIRRSMKECGRGS
ncbi:MAG: 4-alpha-glucanotransferase [Pseudomonadota bacterium]